MAKNWKHDRAAERIEARLQEVKSPEIVDYVRDMALENIPRNRAYHVDGVHLYADILNIDAMLNCTNAEGEMCHKRTLRFLNMHYRAVHRILADSEVIRVDFHNQRLHAVVTKPYNSASDAQKKRVAKAVAVGQLVIEVLSEISDKDEHIDPAIVRIGIDTGSALAVSNGRPGNAEPLFLGRPANKAAKRAAGGSDGGIYLTNEARVAIGLAKIAEKDLDTTPLTIAQIETCWAFADLGLTKGKIIKLWKEDMDANPIGEFDFSAHTPPFKDMPIDSLTPKNSRRQDGISLYADLDGFTNFVDRHIAENPEHVVKVMHVLRSEMDSVFSSDFEGLKVRFIGDCIHGVMAEGTAYRTDVEETISTAVICAGGIRSSFDLALEKLKAAQIDVKDLGLQIGIEYGPIAITRLGMRGDMLRCAISRGVVRSELEQGRCNDKETALGPEAYRLASEAVQNLFKTERKAFDLGHDEALDSMSLDGDIVAKAVARAAHQAKAPAIARAIDQPMRSHCKKGN